jgi:hypothetical protein
MQSLLLEAFHSLECFQAVQSMLLAIQFLRHSNCRHENVSNTDVRPANAPRSITSARPGIPMLLNAAPTGATLSMSVYLTIPVMTAETAMYRTVQMLRLPIIPIGRSLWGFFDSCATVVTESNPMYAKKTTTAPSMTPDAPYAVRTPVFGGTKGT